jgi:hypothetical protein
MACLCGFEAACKFIAAQFQAEKNTGQTIWAGVYEGSGKPSGVMGLIFLKNSVSQFHPVLLFKAGETGKHHFFLQTPDGFTKNKGHDAAQVEAAFPSIFHELFFFILGNVYHDIASRNLRRRWIDGSQDDTSNFKAWSR